MAAFFKLFFALLVFVSISQAGRAQCQLSNITVHQSKTGVTVNGKPEFEVEVNNNCICCHENVQLSCKGFNSVEPVDPTIFRPIGNNRCILNDGMLIYYNTPIKFKYAQDDQIYIAAVYSQMSCS